ncbi:SnoaL-like domain protein [Phycisphaerae bacterium RAS1]|nr:SnoaL-like domain protein [Phycisphaerae bacterium RAS1]
MSAAMDAAALEADLNAMILKGAILDAFEKHYAEDVAMQENADPPCRGKAANRAREQAFVDSVAALHAVRLLGGAVTGERAYSEWEMDVTFKNGQRVLMTQCAARRWQNGKVAQERFYYNKSG